MSFTNIYVRASKVDFGRQLQQHHQSYILQQNIDNSWLSIDVMIKSRGLRFFYIDLVVE